MSEATAILPETEAPAYIPPPPQPQILVERLESLDRDYSGEARFCTIALSTLRAFLARHENDIAVSDSYGKAIAALEALPGILAAAQDKHANEVTRKVFGRVEDVRQASWAQQAREHADQWANSAPPMPAPDAAVEPPEMLPDVLRTQFDPTPVAPLPAGLSDAPPTPTDAAATPPPLDPGPGQAQQTPPPPPPPEEGI